KEAKAHLDSIQKPVTTAQKKLDALTADLEKSKKKLEAIGPSFENDWFRNRPLADFIDPTIRVKQTVVANLRDDIYFAKVMKVDRCQTCHLAIDRKGYDGSIVHVKGRGLVSVLGAEVKNGSYELSFADGHKETVADQQIGASTT